MHGCRLQLEAAAATDLSLVFISAYLLPTNTWDCVRRLLRIDILMYLHESTGQQFDRLSQWDASEATPARCSPRVRFKSRQDASAEHQT